MLRKKKEEGTAALEEERNQFIREQVRPQRKKQVLLWLRRLGILIVAASIFGGVAGGVIVCIQNYLLRDNENPGELSVYPSHFSDEDVDSDEDSSEEKNTAKAAEGKKEQETPLGRLNEITRRLAAVGSRLDASLVGIEPIYTVSDWLSGEYRGQRAEYGLIFQESGQYYYILTTDVVTQGQVSVTVQLMDDTTVEGVVMGNDVRLNIAVVRVSKANIKSSLLSEMEVAKLGTGSGMINGTNVIAVGCPNGVLGSVVIGHVTNDSVQASIIDGEVQVYCTDMPYSDSGNGVVLDTGGKVAGILTTQFTNVTGTTGMSFVRMSGVLPVLDLLRKGDSVPYLGIEGVTLSENQAKEHKLKAGAFVTEVYTESPAYRSGMRVADVITRMDGSVITGMADIHRRLIKTEVGTTVSFTVSRRLGEKQIEKEFLIRVD